MNVAEPPGPVASSEANPCDTATEQVTNRPAGCGAAVTSYTICSASDQCIAYVSAGFQVTATANVAWIDAFTQFLAQKYSYKGGGVGCNNTDPEHAQTFLKGTNHGFACQ